MKCKEKNYWFLFFNRSTHSEVFCKILKFKQNSQEYTYDGGFCFNKVIKCSATFRSFHISRKLRKHKSSASSETFTTSFFFTWQGLVFTTYFCTFFICNSVITKLWSKLCQLSTVHLRFGGRIFWKTGNKFLNCVRNQSHYCKPTEYSLAKRDINKNKKQENSHNGI